MRPKRGERVIPVHALRVIEDSLGPMVLQSPSIVAAMNIELLECYLPGMDPVTRERALGSIDNLRGQIRGTV